MINSVLLHVFVLLCCVVTPLTMKPVTHTRVEECSKESSLTEMSDESELIHPPFRSSSSIGIR